MGMRRKSDFNDGGCVTLEPSLISERTSGLLWKKCWTAEMALVVSERYGWGSDADDGTADGAATTGDPWWP